MNETRIKEIAEVHGTPYGDSWEFKSTVDLIDFVDAIRAEPADAAAEPVAWRYRYHSNGEWRLAKEGFIDTVPEGFEQEPLYTHRDMR